jgi:NAD+ synthetase
MKIALAQVNPTIGDFAGNFRLIEEAAQRAKGLGCGLVVFPELVTTGYPPRDLLEEPWFVERSLEGLSRLTRSVRGIGVVLGYVEGRNSDSGRRLHNSAILFEDGRVLARARKLLLPTYDVFDEERYFEPGRRPTAVLYKGLRLGLTICEDIWGEWESAGRRLYRADPVERLGRQGLDLLLNVSASPYFLGKNTLRQGVMGRIAREHGFTVIYVNQVGGNDELIFDGNSVAVSPTGEPVAWAAAFAPDLIVYDTEAGSGDRRSVPASEEEELACALTLGLRDYARKCGFRSVLLGLSGGVDSSLVAALAVRALGPENVLGVLMPSPYTSRASVEDAAELAANLGLRTLSIPITGIFAAYLDALAPAFTGRAPDTTEENIQARIRGNLLMALSNKFGHLLLTTGNKSEMAVGYCTLYGDMSGGLAAVSDVPKTMVYRLARYINREREVIPARVFTKAPSAELRAGQTDQESLPPYEVLDPILRLYVEERLSPAEIAAQGFDLALVEEVVAQVRRNEYKRWQSPPGLKVTTKAFGLGRRYPIAQAT